MQMFKVWQRVVLHYPNERAADRCGLQISDKEVSQNQSRDLC